MSFGDLILCVMVFSLLAPMIILNCVTPDDKKWTNRALWIAFGGSGLAIVMTIGYGFLTLVG